MMRTTEQFEYGGDVVVSRSAGHAFHYVCSADSMSINRERAKP